MLVVYLLFLFSETLLFNSNSLEIEVPWASFDRKLAIINVFMNLIISLSLIFDKSGSLRGYTDLLLFALQTFVAHQRFTHALLFEPSVFYATLAYNFTAAWLYLAVGMHLLTGTQLTITTVVVMVLIGVAFSLSMIQYRVKMKDEQVLTKDTWRFEKPIEYMVYLFRMYEVIENEDASSAIMLCGKIR